MNFENREALAEVIKKAFAKTPYPESGYIGSELQDDFEGKTWQDISVQTLFWWRDQLGSFSYEAFRFFLPAFLVGVILYPKEVDRLTDNVIYDLSPKDDSLRREVFSRKVILFSHEEREAIYKFLAAYRELEPNGAWSVMEDAAQDLDRAIEFWREFTQSSL